MRQLFRDMRDTAGNLPSLQAVFPDNDGAGGLHSSGRDARARYDALGLPATPNLGSAPVTNVRNLKSPYWHGWLKPE